MAMPRLTTTLPWPAPLPVAAAVAFLALVASSAFAAEGGAAILALVKAGDAAALQSVLAADEQAAHAAEVDGTTALHWAVHLDDEEAAATLLAAGADATAANRYGVTPLSLASVNGNAGIIARLLAAGAEAGQASREGETALMTASRTGNAAAVELLLAHGADPNARETWRGQTALMWAAAERHLEATESLVRYGADVGARSDGEFTPLLFAVRAGDEAVARALVAAGADIDAADADGHTPLVLAILNGHYALAAELLALGADPEAATPGGTALHHAVRWRRYEFTDFYRPPPPTTGDLDPLGLDACAAGRRRGAERAHREAVPAGRRLRQQLERAAARRGHAAPDRGAGGRRGRRCACCSPTARIRTGRPTAHVTPLMAAAGMGFNFERSIGTEAERVEAVELLWKLGADLAAVNDKGETAMHGAARSGTTSVVRFLFEHGAALDLESEGRVDAARERRRHAEPLQHAAGDRGGHRGAARGRRALRRGGARPRTATGPAGGTSRFRHRRPACASSRWRGAT